MIISVLSVVTWCTKFNYSVLKPPWVVPHTIFMPLTGYTVLSVLFYFRIHFWDFLIYFFLIIYNISSLEVKFRKHELLLKIEAIWVFHLPFLKKQQFVLLTLCLFLSTCENSHLVRWLFYYVVNIFTLFLQLQLSVFKRLYIFVLMLIYVFN